jgi:hypothetical protein
MKPYEVAVEALSSLKDLACDTLNATSLSVSNVNFRFVHWMISVASCEEV